MSYILVIIFASANAGYLTHLQHVDSIRFDSREACQSALNMVLERTPTSETDSGAVKIACVAAR